MRKKWFFVRYSVQVRDAYAVFMTEKEIETRLKNPDYRGHDKDKLEVTELKPDGTKKARKDLIKKAFA